MKCWHCFREVDGSEEICPYCGRILSVNPDINTTNKEEITGEEITGEDNAGEETADKEDVSEENDKIEDTGEETDPQKTAGKKIIIVISVLAALLLAGFFIFKDKILQNDTRGWFHTHQWVNATCLEPKICSICSLTEGKALGHQWKEATCTEPRTCSRCSETDGKALGHQWKEATCTEPRTCSRCSETDGKALGHQWKEATCTEPRTCSRCKETDGTPLGHDWREATYDTPKTCKRCKITEGTVKGYVSANDIGGRFSDERISISGYDVSAFEFDKELHKCRSIMLGITLLESTADSYGNIAFWARSHGDWVKIGSVYVEELNTVYSDTFDISPAIDIEALAVLPDSKYDYEVSVNFELTIYHAQIE